jgi:outer membrane protein assembly factor BamB
MAARTVASYTFSPSPVAPSGSLAGNGKVAITVTAKDAGGLAIGGATIFLAFTPTSGGGRAASHGKALGTTPQSFRANSSGLLTLSYTAPAVLPSGGTDTLTAQNALSSPTVSKLDTYTFGGSPPPPALDWPMFHHDATHLGVTADTGMTATHAPSLASKWQTTLPTGSYGSPAIVFNATLGKNVLYIGDQAGTGKGGAMTAVDAATGTVLWSFPAGGNILSSPAVANGVVYFGTSGNASHRLIALNATTGSQVCSFTTDFAAPGTSGRIDSSPVVADPGDGGGPVVYFGDSGPIGTGPPDQGAFWAINASTCALKWEFGPAGTAGTFNANPTGEYSQPGFAHDKNGQALVVFGSADTDDSIYALNASTGVQVWRFQTLQGTDTDVGAGPTISAPGINGFADGVVYETGKDRQVYAIDLTTGAQIWSFNIKTLDPTNKGDSQSVSALVGNELVEGWGAGLFALNATTGAKLWAVTGLPTIFSSPAVSGPPGNQVVLVGDAGGTFRAYDLNGTQLFSAATGGFIYSSPAVSGGTVFFANAMTGVLYAYS